MKTTAKPTTEGSLLRYGVTLAVFFWMGFSAMGEAMAQKVRVAMPAKSMTFLNFYVGDKFGIYKAEGLEVSLEVIKTEVGVAGMPDVPVDEVALADAKRLEETGNRGRSGRARGGGRWLRHGRIGFRNGRF